MFIQYQWIRFRSSRGQALPEYALAVVLIAMIAIAGLTVMNGALTDMFTMLGNVFTNNTTDIAPPP